MLFILWEHSLICFVPFQSRNCSLHLSQEFTRLYPGSQAQPIMSRESAPGLILASGTVGSSLKNQQDMFVSRDGGFTWYQVSPHCSQLFPDSNPGNMLGPVYNPFGYGQHPARIGPNHICARSNFLHLIQFTYSKEGMDHTVQNRQDTNRIRHDYWITGSIFGLCIYFIPTERARLPNDCICRG